MGRGIAQVLAQCGARTLVFDAQPGAAQKAQGLDRRRRSASWPRRAACSAAEAQATLGRIEVVESLEAFAPCHVVVEAIVEELGAKRELFSALEKIVQRRLHPRLQHLVALGDRDGRGAASGPERVAGYHFFNPVPVMKIVEVVDGVLTEPWVDRRAHRARQALRPHAGALQGHARASSSTTPAAPSCPKSLRVLSEGVADFATIDRILVDAAGFRLGPFGLMDLVGLDVAHAVMKSMYQQYYEEPKYRPSFLAEPRVAAGLLGRKTGRGWYAYGKDGAAEAVPEPPVPAQQARSRSGRCRS